MVPINPEDAHLAWRQHKAVEAAAFRKKYPLSQRLKTDYSWSINASQAPLWPFTFLPFAKDWLDAACPGWSLLHTSGTCSLAYGSYIGFAEPDHMVSFAAAVSMMDCREKRHGRQNEWARNGRAERATEMGCFRAKYPATHRLRFSARSQIWHESSTDPYLIDEVVEWLDDNAPGWLHLPKTHLIGFSDPYHAVCFKTVWG